MMAFFPSHEQLGFQEVGVLHQEDTVSFIRTLSPLKRNSFSIRAGSLSASLH